jgi:hypothetical protein
MNKKPDGIELALLHALRYELATFKVSDKKARWDLNESESKAVEKWLVNRMADISKRLNT